MLANFLKKNMNIILINTKTLTTIYYFIIADFYIQLYLNKASALINLLSFFKYSSFFNLDVLIDIKCEDIVFFSKKHRFKVTYIFLSLTYNIRYFIIVFLEKNESLQSLSFLFSSASYLERQIWDQFGIIFNLNGAFVNRRILTDYGFKGKPLKKDFPLSGFSENIYSYEKARVQKKPISLLQENRKFTRA